MDEDQLSDYYENDEETYGQAMPTHVIVPDPNYQFEVHSITCK
jgi:hypothetical protein